jgi:outer membrane receptor protein involved in Fe transport
LKYDYNYSRYRELNVNYASGEQVDINRQNEIYASLAFQSRFAKSFGYSVATDLSYATLVNNFGESNGPGRFSSYTALMFSHWWRRGEVQAGLFALYASDDVSSGKSPAPYRRLSPSLSLLYKPFLNVPLRVCLSFKDSYRVPTFADLYYQRLGNVGLKPERATQCNVGLLWDDRFESIGKVGVRVDVYYNSVRDKIVALPTMYIWRMVNFGEAEMFGVDANISWNRNFAESYSISCNLNYSWQYAVDVTDKSAKNYRDQLPYTPSHSGNLSLVFENPIVNVSYMLSCVGERYMLPQNVEKNRMPGYFEHSFSANREFAFGDTRLRLQGELLNLGDESYEVIRYYPMPGFSWRLSARLSF